MSTTKNSLKPKLTKMWNKEIFHLIFSLCYKFVCVNWLTIAMENNNSCYFFNNTATGLSLKLQRAFRIQTLLMRRILFFQMIKIIITKTQEQYDKSKKRCHYKLPRTFPLYSNKNTHSFSAVVSAVWLTCLINRCFLHKLEVTEE